MYNDHVSLLYFCTAKSLSHCRPYVKNELLIFVHMKPGSEKNVPGTIFNQLFWRPHFPSFLQRGERVLKYSNQNQNPRAASSGVVILFTGQWVTVSLFSDKFLGYSTNKTIQYFWKTHFFVFADSATMVWYDTIDNNNCEDMPFWQTDEKNPFVIKCHANNQVIYKSDKICIFCMHMKKSRNYAGCWIFLEGCINNNNILNPLPERPDPHGEKVLFEKKVSGCLETFFRYPLLHQSVHLGQSCFAHIDVWLSVWRSGWCFWCKG